MKKTLKRLCTGFLALATVVTALPTTPVHAESKQYWTESKERVGIVEKVMNDGSIGSTFNEGHLTVEGEDAYCIDINTEFKNGYKTRADASTRMSADQISDVALSIEYVKQYTDSHSGISNNHAYLLRQLVVWQRLSVHLGWQCDNVRASYDEIPKATQDEVFAGAKAFVKENKGRYECGGYIYSGEGQELGQFWAKLNVGNAKLKKTSSNTSITDGNGNYSIAGATYGVFADKDCTKQLATLTTDKNGNTDVAEVKAGTVYIKELSAPAGYKVDKRVYPFPIYSIEARTQAISGYLTKELQDLNVDTIRIDIPTSSTVTNVIVWSIEQSGTDTFSATYEVDQQIKEGEQTNNVKATYTVKVHVDADGDMVIVQNPTLAPAVEKSDYEPKTPEADASVDADTVNDATAFLETFFKLYPTDTEKELSYYVSGNALEPIGRDYLYSELVNPIFTKDGDNVKVKVAVKFLDNQTKATLVSQYELVLHKDSNWKIVG